MSGNRIEGDDLVLIHAQGDDLAGLEIDAIDRARKLWGQGAGVRIEKIESMESRRTGAGFAAGISVRLLSEPYADKVAPDSLRESGGQP